MDVVQKMDIEAYNYDTELHTGVLTVSSGYDGSMDQCFDISREEIRSSSPIPKCIITSKSHAYSPERHHVSLPHRTVRALRLFDSPFTPKTLYAKCSDQTPASPALRSRLFHRNEKPRGLPYADKPPANINPFTPDKPSANINPFTPDGKLLMSNKRTRSKRSLVG